MIVPSSVKHFYDIKDPTICFRFYREFVVVRRGQCSTIGMRRTTIVGMAGRIFLLKETRVLVLRNRVEDSICGSDTVMTMRKSV